MKSTSQEARQIIEERILAEYKKHPTLDWAKIAAHKIYSTLFDAPTAGDNWNAAKKVIDVIRAGNLGREKSAYFSEIHDAVDALEKSIKGDKWISVDKELPKEEEKVNAVFRCRRYGDVWRNVLRR